MIRARSFVALLPLLGASLLCNCSGGGGSGASSSASGVTALPSAAPSATAQAQLWIQPKPYNAGATGMLGGGSADFTSMFAGTTAWPETLAHTNVFGFYAGWTADIDTPTLTTAINFLNAEHIPIELEAPAMQATASCGTGVEGYVPYGQLIDTFTNGYLQRLKTAGADVWYIKVDEPYFFGVLDIAHDPRACALTVSQVAAQVAHYAALVHAIYPNAEVGDVEPLVVGPYSPDVNTALASWHDAVAAAGAPFPFFVADMDFSNPAWTSLAQQLQTTMHGRGEQFGIIFIGDPTDTSDAVWAGKTVSRAETFMSAPGSAPDFVFFQSWDPAPSEALPETVSTTFTGVVKAYIDSRN